MPMSLPVWSTGITTVVMGIACVTDLRWRRIPNLVTFPAVLISLIVHTITGGWGGLLFSSSGALLAPVLLHLLHAGKGPGGGDLKLAAVLGASLGPLFGALAVLISTVAGGIFAAVWMLIVTRRRRHPPSSNGSTSDESADNYKGPLGNTTIPYGPVLAFGALAVLIMYWIGGTSRWLM